MLGAGCALRENEKFYSLVRFMKMKLLVLIVLPLWLISCGYDDPLKPGYVGIRSSDESINENVKIKLTEKGISFYTYEEEGKEVIAYQVIEREKVGSIFNEATGSPPPDYTGLCSDTNESAEKELAILIENDIPAIIRKSYSVYCVYWNKEYSNKVESFNSNYKQIREHQRSIGNEI